MNKRRIIHTSEGEEHLHRETWRVVTRQFERPDNPNKGRMYDDLVAMMFASHTLEGYVNYLGDKILPVVWKNERDIPGGFKGKLTRILRACEMPDFNVRSRPFSTVATLTVLRDAVAHPKTRKQKTTHIYGEGREPPLLPRPILKP